MRRSSGLFFLAVIFVIADWLTARPVAYEAAAGVAAVVLFTGSVICAAVENAEGDR